MPDNRTVPGVCRSFNSPNSECTRDFCQELHVCFFFATGRCRSGDKCTRTHLLTTVQNQSVLRANGWHHDYEHTKLLELLEERFREKNKTYGPRIPRVCFTYNTLGCENDNCKHLHLCLNSVMNKCPLGDKCHLEHDLVKSDHNIRVLRNAKLLDTEQQLIAEKLRQMYIAKSNQQNKQEPKKKEHHSKQKEKSAQEPKGKDTPMKQDAEKDKQKPPGRPCACIAYNKSGCNKASCPFLHVCFSLIMGSCNKKGKWKCLKEHDILKTEQNKEILRKFDLLDAEDVIAKIREGYEARAAAKAAAKTEAVTSGEAVKGGEAAASGEAVAVAIVEASDDASGGATPTFNAAQWHATPPASLTCAVCRESLIRATTLGCTHTFCEECVRQVERQGQPCPLCRAPIATAVRSLVIDDMVVEWFDGQDEETQRARRQLVTERRRAAVVPQPLRAAPTAVQQLPRAASAAVQQLPRAAPAAAQQVPRAAPAAVQQPSMAAPAPVQIPLMAVPTPVQNPLMAVPPPVQNPLMAAPPPVRQSPMAAPPPVRQSPMAAPPPVRQSPMAAPPPVRQPPMAPPAARQPYVTAPATKPATKPTSKKNECVVM